MLFSSNKSTKKFHVTLNKTHKSHDDDAQLKIPPARKGKPKQKSNEFFQYFKRWSPTQISHTSKNPFSFFSPKCEHEGRKKNKRENDVREKKGASNVSDPLGEKDFLSRK